MSRPKLIMMDEPSLGLAPLIVQGVFDIIREINQQGVTILLVEQNANMALHAANRGYVMETGLITMTGTGQELAANEDIKAAYLGKKRAPAAYTEKTGDGEKRSVKRKGILQKKQGNLLQYSLFWACLCTAGGKYTILGLAPARRGQHASDVPALTSQRSKTIWINRTGTIWEPRSEIWCSPLSTVKISDS